MLEAHCQTKSVKIRCPYLFDSVRSHRMHFEKVVIGGVIGFVGSLVVFGVSISTINNCIFQIYGSQIGPSYSPFPYSPFTCDYYYKNLYLGLAISLPVLGAGIWIVLCGLTERTIKTLRKEGPLHQ